MFELFVNPFSDPLGQIIVRAALALLFLNAVLHKSRSIKHFKKFQEDLKAYELLPKFLISTAAILLIISEWLLVFSLPILSINFPLPLTAALLFLYASSITINLVRGRTHIDCGCYGPKQSQSNIQEHSINAYLVVRNIFLAGTALFVSLENVSLTREMLWLDFVSFPLAVFTIIFLYQSLELFFSQRSFVKQFNQHLERSAA